MIGAIAGDIAGQPYEFNNIKTKNFIFFSTLCRPTDDSAMTLAVAQALLDTDGRVEGLAEAAVRRMQEVGRRNPRAGYGGHFRYWLREDDPQPYNSWGNGAAMRVSGCGWAGRTLEEALALSDAVTGVSHNHPEGIKGARATTAAIFLLRTGTPVEEVRRHIVENYYPLDFTLDEIRPDYEFNESCQETVPQALVAFFEAKDYEDTIRNAISIGGDSDTLACIAGAIAEARWPVPFWVCEDADPRLKRFDSQLPSVLAEFEKRFGAKREQAPMSNEELRKLVSDCEIRIDRSGVANTAEYRNAFRVGSPRVFATRMNDIGNNFRYKDELRPIYRHLSASVGAIATGVPFDGLERVCGLSNDELRQFAEIDHFGYGLLYRGACGERQ